MDMWKDKLRRSKIHICKFPKKEDEGDAIFKGKIPSGYFPEVKPNLTDFRIAKEIECLKVIRENREIT